MSPEISERSFEAAIERALLAGGPDVYPRRGGKVAEPASPSYGDQPHALPDRARNVVDFTLATQPKECDRLKQYHGAEVRERAQRGDATALSGEPLLGGAPDWQH